MNSIDLDVDEFAGLEEVPAPWTLSGKGMARFANIHVLQNWGNEFPDIDIGEVVTALEITQFQMTFPLAKIA